MACLTRLISHSLKMSMEDPNCTPLKKELSITVPVSASKSPSPAPVYCTTSPFNKKERIRCLFCGGDQCKRCSPTAYLALENPAIPKLHSSWINESIVAMQRPSDALFDQGALEGLVAARITAVFNLTEPGEHPYCGTGILEETGFPYSPERLMNAGSRLRSYILLKTMPHDLYITIIDSRNSQAFQFSLARHDRAVCVENDGDRTHRRQRN